MGEPFKNLIDPPLVQNVARHLARVAPGFDRQGFEVEASSRLDELELKARVRQVANALVRHLPGDTVPALAAMCASLGPPGAADRITAMATTDRGLAGWAVWPLTEAVAAIAIEQPAAGLDALHAMTQRFSAEFAIRPFIARHPRLCFERLQRWVSDPSAHVRRLVSEGSRPRLPWGMRLQALVDDPSPTLPLLAALQDDPCEDVRRSVANHLNDIAKDHPALIAAWLSRHLPGASSARRALLRHASRSLIKQGDPEVMAAWGLAEPLRGTVRASVEPRRLEIGGEVMLRLELHSTAAGPQRLAIDYAVHHVKADGRATPKVFKGWVVELGAGEQRQLAKRHSFKPVTVRRYHPGRHVLHVQVNGREAARLSVMLVDAPAPA